MKTYNIFQQVMKNAIRNINSSKNIIVAADKTRNMYKMSHKKYDKLVNNSATLSYRKAEDNVSKSIVDKMNISMKCKADVNQARSTKKVIRLFNKLENEKQLSFLTFDIVVCYTSINDNLLLRHLDGHNDTTT